MKRRNKLLAVLTAFTIAVTSVIPVGMTSIASESYEKGKVYDATEAYIKLQAKGYRYNGYKVAPFVTCDTYLSGIGVGTEYAFATEGALKQGDKVVIEFHTPIDSKKFEIITISMKQVPGNTYHAYNASDDILSTVRKTISFGSYDVEKFSFPTELFADENGMVNAIILKNVKADMAGQLFVDEFSVGDSPYTLNTKYDATLDYFKLQNATSYEGLTVVPFGLCNTFWDKEAQLEDGYALIASKPEGAPVEKGEVLVLEFVNDISAKKFKYINLSMVTATQGGSTLEFYNANDISGGKLGSAKQTKTVNFWEFTTISLPTASFADENGTVNKIVMKLVSEEANTLSVGGFSLSAKPKTASEGMSGSTGSVTEGADRNNQFDATNEYIRIQTTSDYKGIKIVPFMSFGTELSELGSGEGYSVYTHDNIKKGDVVVIEFVEPIDSQKVDLLTLSLKQTPGYSYSMYRGDDTSLSKVVKTLNFGSYEIEKFSLRSSLVAGDDGKISSIILKCEKAGEPAGQMFIDGYSFGKDPYQLGVTYDMTEDYVKIQKGDSYNGVAIAPFSERTTFWSQEAKLDSEEGYSLVVHRADNTEPKKNDVMVLEFVTDIDTSKYEVLNLTLATAAKTGAILEVYNVYEIQSGKLGNVKQKVKADFWSFKTNSIALEALADENGYVGAIAFRLVSDEAQTLSVGSFSLELLSGLIKQDAPQILDNKITVIETENAYEFTVEFNSTGALSGTYNEETVGNQISLNGVKVSDINKEKKYAELKLELAGVYCLTLSVNKDYDGDGAVINMDKHFVGNCVEIAEGFELPNGEKLRDTYALHVYLVDSITDVVDDSQTYKTVDINSLSSLVDEHGNLIINVHFNNEITGNAMFYLCNPDSFNRKEVAKFNAEATLYDEKVAEAFIYGGYKSSLLDHLKINDNSIGEWLAMDEVAGSMGYHSAIMVHYGQMSNKVVTIMVAKTSKISETINECYANGTLSITLEEGLKFTSGRAITENITYQYEDAVWSKTTKADFSVYYDGHQVEDGDQLKVDCAVSANNISIVGKGNYEIQEKITGDKAEYTILEGSEELMKFTVEGTMVIPVYSQNQLPIIAIVVIGVAILGAGVVVYFIRKGKKHAEKKSNE